MTTQFKMLGRLVFIDCHRKDYPGIGFQIGGHGQTGVFLSLWLWVIWLRWP